MSTRAGIGWDSHRLEAGESLILGGIRDQPRDGDTRATPTRTC